MGRSSSPPPSMPNPCPAQVTRAASLRWGPSAALDTREESLLLTCIRFKKSRPWPSVISCQLFDTIVKQRVPNTGDDSSNSNLILHNLRGLSCMRSKLASDDLASKAQRLHLDGTADACRACPLL